MGFIGDQIVKIVGGLIATLYTWLVKPFQDLKLFKTLIFGEDSDEELAYGIFTLDELEKIYQPGMNITVILAVTAILIGITIAGIKISSSAINPSNRTYVYEFLKDLAIVAIVFFNLSTIYTLIFGVNYSIVNVFSASLESGELIELKEEISMEGDDLLGELLIGLTLIGLTVWANFYYLMRKLTLLLFMILGPLMIALYLIPQTKAITAGWFKEFVGTVFVQSIHAFLYWATALISLSKGGIEALIIYVIFIPTSEALRSLFGLGGGMQNNLSKAGSMMGMSALAGIYGSVKGATGDKSVTGALKGAYNGVKDRKSGNESIENDEDGKKVTSAANSGTDTGSTTKAEKMLKPGEITSKAGKAAFGMMGSVAGSPLGPAGSIMGSTAGFVAGGAIGGVAGRVGGAGASALGLAGGKVKEGIKEGKNKFNNVKNAEDIADSQVASELADNETSKWASDNKDQFRKDMKERFPDAHDSAIDGMWDEEVDKVRATNIQKAKKTVGAVRKNDGKYANAQSLADANTNSLTNEWANENKDQFYEDFEKNNPLTSDMTEGEILERGQKRGREWKETVDKKRDQYAGVTNGIAQKHAKGLSPNHAFISKEDFSKDLASEAYDLDKSSYVDNHMKQQSSLSTQELENQYEKKNPNRKENLRGVIEKDSERDSSQNASDLANTSANHLTENWAGDNKQKFFKNFKSNNPEASNEDIELEWSSALNSKRKEFMTASTSAAQSLSGSNDLKNSNISTGDFSDQLSSNLLNTEKKEYAFNHKNGTENAKQDIELDFDSQSNGPRKYLQQAKNTSNGVKTGQLYNRKDVNTGYLASQIANVKTAEDKQQFIQDKSNNSDLSMEQVEQQWSAKEASVHAGHLKNYSQNMPQQIGLDQSISRFKPNTKMRGISAGVAGITGGVTSITGGPASIATGGVAGIATGGIAAGIATSVGTSTFGKMMSDSKLGKVTKAGMIGFGSGFSNANKSAPTSNSSTEIMTAPLVNGISEAKENMKVAWNTPQDAETLKSKQQGFTNAVSYTAGVIAGPGGYQKAGKYANKYNPYNKAVNQQTQEVSDIGHMAQQVDDGYGNKKIAPGALRMVTTGDQSYIQVKDKTGQQQIVSRYGSGDSSLRKGETVYQDLNIEDGSLVQQSTPYKLDSGGGKLQTNRSINVNPSRLVSTKTVNHQEPKDIQSMNQDVDAGQFTSDDVQRQTRNIRMVVSKERSYMVAEDMNTGQDYRVSPYGKGDARLQTGEEKTVKYNVRNKRIVNDEVIDQNGKEDQDYTSSLSPDDLIPSSENKRLQRRKDFDKVRHQSIGGAR
ncbi:hypothetical protein [Halobacillus litoralis]|uniref:Uncharacterized protein n=1 Tax=Halobacillus litoralis TaxID=45668 RepID=A0A410MJ79_9BACI|nr:hypothetical protein [Halobacillus litoralis]QAS54779.1 hypothetical protein HLI_21215 [Halobacillus litoralis]